MRMIAEDLVVRFRVPEPPPLTKMAALMEGSAPVQSSATLTLPPAALMTFSATSFSPSDFSMTTVETWGTSFLAKSSRDWKRSVMTIGWHPAARQAKSVTRPIGPAPLWEVVRG